MSDLVSPQNAACKKPIQYVTVKVTNNGTNQQKNFPLSLLVKKGATTILNINETFNGRLVEEIVAVKTYLVAASKLMGCWKV